MKISIVSPVYNEAKNLPIFYRKIVDSLKELKVEYEIIFINDGSFDKSGEVLLEFAKKNKKLKVIEFTRNFGQTAAIQAGIKLSSGKVIVLIDSDLQNDPEDIKKLLLKIAEGYDVVSGWRKKRKDPFLTRTLPSLVANKLISLIVGLNLHDYGCTLKAYRREVLDNFTLYGEMHRLVPVYAAFSGARITEVIVRHHPRKYGKSHYNMWRVFKILFDLLTVKFLHDFSSKPLYLFGMTGLAVFGVGIVMFLFVVVRVILFSGGWISPMILLSGLLVVLSFQFILIGLLAEIMVRVYFESQDRKPYVVKRKINFS